MKILSNDIEQRLKRLSNKTNDIHSIKPKSLLRNIIYDDNRKFNKINYNLLLSQIPMGTYRTIYELVQKLYELNVNNTKNILEYSPLHINDAILQHCKKISYKQSHVITGRDKEIEKVILSLTKRTKRSCMLIGEAGTGKTAIAEGINTMIIHGTVPNILKNTNIYHLDIPYLLSKNKKNDPTEIIINILEAAAKNDDIILFIDEIHMIMGSGGMGNILKPYLTSKIRMIGATTRNEYFGMIATDDALERRFTLIDVEEPTIIQTINMLKNSKKSFEDEHCLSISNDVITYAVSNGSRFLGNRRNPDKSVDVIDIACTLMNTYEIKNNIPNNKSNDILLALDDDRNNINNTKVISGNRTLSEKYIDKSISFLTNIDYSKIKDGLTYNNVIKTMSKYIFGQDNVIKDCANIINLMQHVDYDRQKPLSTLLFVGTAGTGKTHTIKTLTNIIYGSAKNYIEYDLSAFTSDHMISEFRGAPPGYVGYDKGGQLIKRLRNKPQSILYFKNFNKAHPNIITYLLNMINKGILSDTSEREVKLNNTIIIYGITLSDEEAKYSKSRSMGFIKDTTITNSFDLKKIAGDNILATSEIILEFNKLDEKSLNKIYEKNVDHYLNMYRNSNIDENKLKNKVMDKSTNGHDIINKLNNIIPKMVFEKLKQQGD